MPLTILSLLSPAAAGLLATASGPTVGFPDLMAVLVNLAAAGQGQGHVILFQAVLEWMQVKKHFYAIFTTVNEFLDHACSKHSIFCTKL